MTSLEISRPPFEGSLSMELFLEEFIASEIRDELQPGTRTRGMTRNALHRSGSDHLSRARKDTESASSREGCASGRR